MKTYIEYARSFNLDYDPGMLDFGMNKEEYCIYEGSKLLLTPGGNAFKHPSEKFIRHLITDLQIYAGISLPLLSSPILFSYKNDILNKGEDPFLLDWTNQLTTDHFVQSKDADKNSTPKFTPDDPLFSFSFISLSGLIDHVSRFTAKQMGEVVLEENEQQPFSELLKICYKGLTTDQKVAVHALSSVHQSGIVLPFLLVTDEITPPEYAKGLISLKLQPKELYPEIYFSVAGIKAFFGSLIQNASMEKPLSSLISQGEGDSVEFKSTLRWDIRAGKTNPAIERACLKTISAFLNSNGGFLLIGIRDDGSIEGIETDKLANDDKFLLHLWTLIRNCLGKNFSPFIQTSLEKKEGKTVCVVKCFPANRPVFLRQPGFDEEMFIRVGPSSNALDISEALNYIQDHFTNK